ncbi:MAG: TRAP transporter permease [Lachnospiraceae bacterium]|nr:TRAP transporter permease [Lachnospiraceae bacterium]
MAKGKKEKKVTGTRKFEGGLQKGVLIFCIVCALVMIFINAFSLMITVKKNAIALSFMLALTFIFYPATSRSRRDMPSVPDWILAVLSVVTCIFIFSSYDSLIARNLEPTMPELVFAGILVVLVLESVRRSTGYILPILALIFILYAKFGIHFPGILRHKGFLWPRILIRLGLADTGIWGTSLTTAASYVFMFIMFGCFLNSSGTAKFFNDFAISFAGRLRGGPAQVSVVSSGLMGTISGSAQANVATTGAFTIPLMKKVGYSDRFAAAVEAAASTGGILMPPVMGAASFVMASFLGIPYATVMKAGIIPALLYYFSIFFMVDLRARKMKLTGMNSADLPKVSTVFRESGHMLVPIVVVIYTLLAGYSAIISAFCGIVSTIVLSTLRKSTRMTVRKLFETLAEATRASITVTTACALVGIIVAVVGMTGLGQVIALNIMKLSHGHLWIALAMIMVSALILGMGLPSTACYIITSSVAAPALVTMGIPPLVAHFFAFYYGTMSGIVPPVALTSYTAAGLSGANPMKVALSGLRLASAGLIIPFCFAYSPILLLQGDYTAGTLITVLISAMLGIYFLGCGLEGYFRTPLHMVARFLLVGFALCLIVPGWVTDIVGVGGAVITLAISTLLAKRKEKAEAAA